MKEIKAEINNSLYYYSDITHSYNKVVILTDLKHHREPRGLSMVRAWHPGNNGQVSSNVPSSTAQVESSLSFGVSSPQVNG